MSNKLSMEHLRGGDTVLLDDGKIVKVYDVHPLYILATNGLWYEMKRLERIVEKAK